MTLELAIAFALGMIVTYLIMRFTKRPARRYDDEDLGEDSLFEITTGEARGYAVMRAQAEADKTEKRP